MQARPPNHLVNIKLYKDTNYFIPQKYKFESYYGMYNISVTHVYGGCDLVLERYGFLEHHGGSIICVLIVQKILESECCGMGGLHAEAFEPPTGTPFSMKYVRVIQV